MMPLEECASRWLRAHGYDLYTVLTWRARIARYRMRVITCALVLAAALAARAVYFTVPEWFGSTIQMATDPWPDEP